MFRGRAVWQDIRMFSGGGQTITYSSFRLVLFADQPSVSRIPDTNPMSRVTANNPARGIVIVMNRSRVSTDAVFWRITIKMRMAKITAIAMFTLAVRELSLSFLVIAVAAGYARK